MGAVVGAGTTARKSAIRQQGAAHVLQRLRPRFRRKGRLCSGSLRNAGGLPLLVGRMLHGEGFALFALRREEGLLSLLLLLRQQRCLLPPPMLLLLLLLLCLLLPAPLLQLLLPLLLLLLLLLQQRRWCFWRNAGRRRL